MATNTIRTALKLTSLLGLTVILAACTSGSSGLSSSTAEKPAVVEQPLATGAPKIAKISTRGGTKIVRLVNNQPITTNDIKRRAAFVKLRRMKGNSRTIALKELTEEALKMQEARRIRAVAGSKEVDAAYIRFAKGNKMPPKILTRVLNKRGVTQRGFKEYIRAQMSWQRTVSARLQAESRGRGRSARPNAQAWLSDAGKSTGKQKEYTIQQVVFIVPKAKRSSLLSGRRAQAKRFRNRMQGCSNTRTMAASLKDVTVLDRGRMLEPQLPPRWSKELKATPAGKVTRVKDTERGVEMLAVCKTRQVIGNSTTANEHGDIFTGKNFQKAASKLEKKYLAELQERAVIKNR